MIDPRSTHLTVARVRLARISVTEAQPRYLERVVHYVRLLIEHPEMELGPIAVRPARDGVYELLDGHHRYCAHIIAGRDSLLAVVHLARGQRLIEEDTGEPVDQESLSDLAELADTVDVVEEEYEPA